MRKGERIKMTPSISSFTTDPNKTGSSAITFYTNELNSWVVLKENGDGTVDAISENVSSYTIKFSGTTGYLNYVGYLNELASKYENSSYTVGSRSAGYNGQTEYLSSSKVSFSSPFSSSISEDKGGGDSLYLSDEQLMNSVLGTINANKPGQSSPSNYWVASRMYVNINNYYIYWRGRVASINGIIDDGTSLYDYTNNKFNPNIYFSWSIRPIIKIKAGIVPTGTGTATDPYVLS